MKIPVNKIRPNPQQPRTEFDQAALNELANSIRIHGLLTPILVEEAGEGYILIAGERRWRAAQMLGWETIEANVRPGMNGSGAQERAVLALIENVQRENLNPVEEARAYEKLAEMGLSNAAIAHNLGVSGSRVANRRQLLTLDDEIQDLAASDLLPIDMRAVAAIKSVPAQHRVAFARAIARPGLKISTLQKSAERFNAALAAEREREDPGLKFAAKRAGAVDRSKWDALVQLGQLPPWSKAVAAIRFTCDTCELRGEASAVICSRCPAVVLMARMIEVSREPIRPA